MIKIKLPNGDLKEYQNPITPFEIANGISPSLAKQALIASVNNDLWDLHRLIEKNCNLKILTKKDPECLEVLRHDAAHVLAEAVLELYPDTQITIGPSIDDGFYYDFFRKVNFNLEDLSLIEKRMHEIVDRKEEITREVWERKKAESFYKNSKANFKLELLENILSAKNALPIAMPYSPPCIFLSSQTSMECAYPRSCNFL